MEIRNFVQEFIVEEDRPFDSGHATTLVELKDGNILAAWFAGSWEKGDDVAIWAARRINGVWEKPFVVDDVRGIAMWNPVLFRKNDGTIILFYKVGEEIPTWKTYFVESTDEGATFTSPKELVEGDEIGGRGPVKNKPIRLHDGTILAPGSLEGKLWDAFVDISYDDCKTWTMSKFVPIRRVIFDNGGGPKNSATVDRPYSPYYLFGKGMIQPTLWEDDDHVVHMFCRTTSSRIFASESKDGGKTWELAYDTGLPNNNSGIDLARLKDGRIVLVYNPRENLPGFYKGPRTPLEVAVSCDNGKTFETIKVLEDQPGNYCYPSVIVNDQNEVMITYTWNRLRLSFVKFTLD